MIKLVYDSATQSVELSRPTGQNCETEELLNTAVFLSLFTNRLANPDDQLPDPNGDRQGWWADPYEKVPGHKMGSRLWLLRRSKTTQSVMNLAKQYAEECLQWLIDDEIAESVEVEVERQDSERLAFKVSIQKPGDVTSRWTGVWEAHLAEL